VSTWVDIVSVHQAGLPLDASLMLVVGSTGCSGYSGQQSTPADEQLPRQYPTLVDA
jgi:hypothetical protein